jgi:hypothetical protein
LRHGAARASARSEPVRRAVRPKAPRAEKAIEIPRGGRVVAAVTTFAKRRIGALSRDRAQRRPHELPRHGRASTRQIRAELLDTIFSTETLLHDGAAIVRRTVGGSRRARLPLTERTDPLFRFGIAPSRCPRPPEQSDAVVVVVSEETGSIHVAERGELTPYSDPQWLSRPTSRWSWPNAPASRRGPRERRDAPRRPDRHPGPRRAPPNGAAPAATNGAEPRPSPYEAAPLGRGPAADPDRVPVRRSPARGSWPTPR